MRNGWKIRPLEDVAVIQTGLSKSASRKGKLVDLPYLRVANVQAGRIDTTELKRIGVPESAIERYRVKKGDLLLTEGGDFDKLGRGALWDGSIPDCVHQNHVFVVRANENYLDRHFLALQTQAHHGKSYFLSCSKQSTNLASINTTQLKQFPALLPPLPEQRKIAEILGAWDDALEKLDTLIAAKTRRKQGLMQQLLTGKRRLPGFTGEWRKVAFGKLMQEQNRYVEFDDDYLYRLISVRRRAEGLFLREALHGRDIKTKVMKRVHTGDFLISKMQVVHGALGCVKTEFDGCYVSDSYEVLIPRNPEQLEVRFLDYLSRLKFFWHQAYACSHGVHIEKMTFVMRDFMKEKISIPKSRNEQAAIADILEASDSELQLLRNQRQALEQQKRGLMQQLLTGKVRVKV
ncbi:MAG: restriction endonuclease subunit S [Verrucomicrobiota bacterium JB022]|nr:restriction endonuclease subunit S [Verrucomicrobiota bacterium JB022]